MTFITAKPVRRRKPVYDNGFDRLFNDFFNFDLPTGGARRWPAVNILENDQSIKLEFEVPGWEKSDFRVQIDKNMLTVAAEVAAEKEKTEAEDSYRRREFAKRSFKRSFEIPETVNVEMVEAGYINGILILTLPKRVEDKAERVRSIEIS